MDTRKKPVGVEEHELMAAYNDRENGFDKSNDGQTIPLGVPRASGLLSASDYMLTLLCLSCSCLAVTAVFEARVAAMLGQVRQLIALGIFLQVMALCTQKQFQYFLLLLQCLWHKATLQNIESITRMNMTGPNTSLLLRIAILLCLTFPLGLGAAYKNFTGGLTNSTLIADTGMYGITGPPGTVGINTQGLVLFVNATLPWWTNPGANASFGFNLQVDSEYRSAMLDGPTEEYVTNLRRRLQPGQSMILETTVNATVAEMVIDIANPNMNSNLAYWYGNDTFKSLSPKQATDKFWGTGPAIYANAANTIGFGLLVPWGDWNSSFIMTSRWNTSRGETFGSVAQGFKVYRHQYRARWSITASSISLDGASIIPTGYLTDEISRNTIEINWLRLAKLYPSIIAEHDWKYLGAVGAYVSWANPPVTIQNLRIKTDTTLIAAMVWSRITTWNGLESPVYKGQVKEGSAWNGTLYPSESTYRIQTETLKQHPLLGAVLLVNPVFLLFILAIRITLLKGTPISENFGITSLLAAIDVESKGLLKGASYSGELREDVGVKFLVSHSDYATDGYTYEPPNISRRERIVVKLERMGILRHTGPVRTTRIAKGVVYE